MKKIMSRLEESLNVISIMSWVMTIITMIAIIYLEMNDVSVKWMWNDVSRSYTSESMIMMINQHMRVLIIVAGSTNLISSLLRRICETKEDFETIEENEEFEEDEEL